VRSPTSPWAIVFTVNPWLSCGMCSYCRAGEPMLCSAAAFQGYFGFFSSFDASAHGLSVWRFFSEYITASPQAAGAFAAASDIRPGGALRLPSAPRTRRCVLARCAAAVGVAINGITGTLGVGRDNYSPLPWERRAFSALAAIVTCLHN